MSFPDIDNIYTEGESYGVMGMCYLDPYLYVLYTGGYPSYKPKVHKLNPDTYEKIDEWLAPYDARWAQSMCTDCEYLYVGMSHRVNKRIYVWKVDPNTMSHVEGWYGKMYGSRPYTAGLVFDFQSNRLLVLEDSGPYRIYKLTQDLTEEMHKDAEGGWPPSQWYANDITILGDYCYIASGGTPGAIIKRRISDLEMVDYFSGFLEEPDNYIEGIFFNVCTDGEYIYTATYDYSENRPTRLIKVDPSDMARVSTFYGASDEILAWGSYFYGGKIYMLLDGWDGVYSPDEQVGEIILQIDPTIMTRTARYVNWTGDWNSTYRAVGDGSRLHVGFWGLGTRSVLQFAEEGTVHSDMGIGTKVILSNSKDRSSIERISTPRVGDKGTLMNASNFKCFLPEPSIAVGNICKIFSAKDKRFARRATGAHICNCYR